MASKLLVGSCSPTKIVQYKQLSALERHLTFLNGNYTETVADFVRIDRCGSSEIASGVLFFEEQ